MGHGQLLSPKPLCSREKTKMFIQKEGRKDRKPPSCWGQLWLAAPGAAQPVDPVSSAKV